MGAGSRPSFSDIVLFLERIEMKTEETPVILGKQTLLIKLHYNIIIIKLIYWDTKGGFIIKFILVNRTTWGRHRFGPNNRPVCLHQRVTGVT